VKEKANATVKLNCDVSTLYQPLPYLPGRNAIQPKIGH